MATYEQPGSYQGLDADTIAALQRVEAYWQGQEQDAKYKRGRHKNLDAFIFSGLRPSGMEQELLDKLGALQYSELAKMQSGNLFELDDTTRGELDRIRKLRESSAKGAMDYGMDRAAGAAAAGSAARGLARGSLRAELMARMSDPALQRYQESINQIGVDDANLRIQLPRTDAAFRQQVLQAPGLTALQRSRLATAELRMRWRGQDIQKKANEDANRANMFSAIGTGVGAIAGIAAAPFTGGASLGLTAASLGGMSGSQQATQMADAGLQYGYGSAGTGGGGGYGYVPSAPSNVTGGSLTGFGPGGPGW